MHIRTIRRSDISYHASAAGVIQEALKQDCITAVYGAAHGIKGILEENFLT